MEELLDWYRVLQSHRVVTGHCHIHDIPMVLGTP